MSERKWTKGPWEVVEHSWSDTSVVGPDGTICTIRIYDEATEDNQSALEQRSASRAHMIAAAPKLYEALCGLLGLSDIAFFETESARLGLERESNVFAKARAALQRAEGEG